MCLLQIAVDFDVILRTARQEIAQPVLDQQPVVVVIGPINKIKAAYVVLNNIVSPVPSCLHAIDIAFKACYSVDCDFPPNAYSLWMFIKKAYFKINDPTDVVSTKLNEIIVQSNICLKET